MIRSTSSEIAGAVSLVAVAALLLLAATWAPADWPDAATLSSLRVHLAVLVVLLSIALFILRRWRRAGVLLLAAAFSLAFTVSALLPYASRLPEAAGQQALRVVSFNILYDNAAGGERLARLLEDIRPDFAFIQEAEPLRAHLGALSAILPYRIGCGIGTRNCDLLLLSRHPIRRTSVSTLSYGSPDRMLEGTVTVGGTTLSLVAAHLTKPYFGNLQSQELEALAAAIAAKEGPVLIAGDFNSTPWAPDFLRFLGAADLRLSVPAPGTWPVLAGDVGLPIDHILVREPAAISSLRALSDSLGSNHRGIVADILIPGLAPL